MEFPTKTTGLTPPFGNKDGTSGWWLNSIYQCNSAIWLKEPLALLIKSQNTIVWLATRFGYVTLDIRSLRLYGGPPPPSRVALDDDFDYILEMVLERLRATYSFVTGVKKSSGWYSTTPGCDLEREDG